MSPIWPMRSPRAPPAGSFRSRASAVLRSASCLLDWWLGTQKGEDGQNAPVVLRRGREIELVEDARDVFLDRPLGHDKVLRDCVVRAALGHQPQDLSLAFAQLGERIATPAPPDQMGDHL